LLVQVKVIFQNVISKTVPLAAETGDFYKPIDIIINFLLGAREEFKNEARRNHQISCFHHIW
jgi:hypothetical protein